MPQVVRGAAVACAAQFLVGADGLAVAIALPALRDDLGATPVDAQWVLTAYGLALGGGVLLGGRLGDLYGRRLLLIVGMGLFAAGALVAALAPALGVLVAARALQGAGAAAAVPAALALVGSLFPAGPARRRALGVLAGMASFGIIAGLLLGIVTEWLGWRWVFGVMVAPALLAAVAAPLVLPETRAQAPRRPDFLGAALVTSGAMLLLFALTRVETGNAALALVTALAGAVLLVAFAAWERRAPEPLVRFAVLAVGSLRSATLGVAVNSLAFTAIVYVGTLYLQDGLGYGPLTAGLALIPVDVVAFVVAVGMAGLIRPGFLPVAFVLSAAALAWMARAPVPGNYAIDVLLPLMVLGATIAGAFVVLTNAAVADVGDDEKGLASGIFETANHMFGGAVGIALYATIVAATGYGAAFATAAGLALLGVLTTTRWSRATQASRASARRTSV
jgi:MFS family permease